MTRTFPMLALILGLSAIVCIGCGEEAAPPTSPAAEPNDAPHTEDHGAHDEHDEHDDAGHHGGPKYELGARQVGPYSAEVTQVGSVDAGQPATFEIVLTEEAPQPRAVRAWVGDEQAIGSVKVRAVDRGAFFDADLEVPDPMPEGSRFWIEIETDDGQRHVTGFELHAAPDEAADTPV